VARPLKSSVRLPHDSTERPQRSAAQTLGLCPKTNNCISTAEEANDDSHYVPPWQYNPEDGRGRRAPASREQAMAELVDAVKASKPDNFTPSIIKQTDDYLYVEYQSPTFGALDNVVLINTRLLGRGVSVCHHVAGRSVSACVGAGAGCSTERRCGAQAS
jgi:uncharacterized protein (DUF1499 family)